MVERATTGRPVTIFLAMLLRRGKRPLPEPPTGATGAAAAAAAAGARRCVKSGEGSRALLTVWGCRLRLAAARGVGRSTKAEHWARNARARTKESAAGKDDGRRIVAGIILRIPLVLLSCGFGGVARLAITQVASIRAASSIRGKAST